MADCSKALSDVVDYTHSKDARLTALRLVQRRLDQHEQLEDVLDAVNSKWKKLTDCFLNETDVEILQELSEFLSTAGNTAVVYGRFSVPGINQFIYLSWTSSQLNRLDPAGWPLELILEGLKSCLSDLEGPAFKSMAPVLLRGCNGLLSKAQTPIRLFCKILDVLYCLSKVPSSIRDQFNAMIDLILGWAAFPDCPVESRSKIRILFLKLRPHWEEYLDYGRDLILSVAKDLCNMLDTKLVDAGSAGFANLICCLISIFESCSHCLAPDMLSQLFAQLNLIVQAVTLFPTLNEQDLSIEEFSEQMGEQVKILVKVLMSRKVANGLQNMFNYLNRPMMDPQLHSEAITGILNLHLAFLDQEDCINGLKEIELLMYKAYGLNSAFHNLRSCCSGTMAMSLVKLYKQLILNSTVSIRQDFIQLFLNDVCRVQVDISVPESVPEGPSQSTGVQSGSTVKSIIRVKEQVFGLKLFFECFDSEMQNEGFRANVWDKVSNLVKNEAPKHPMIVSQSIKLLQKLGSNRLESSTVLFKFQTELITKPQVLKNEKIKISVLQWMLDTLENSVVEFRKLPVELEMKLISWLKTDDSSSVSVQKLILCLYCKLLKTGFQFHHKTQFLEQTFNSASSPNTELATGSLEAIKSTGSFTFYKFLDSVSTLDQDFQLPANTGSSCVLSSRHITSLLKSLSTGWSIENNSISRRLDWILQLCHELIPGHLEQNQNTVFASSRNLLHEIAKQIIINRFRHFKSGPAHLLGHLSDQFTQIQQSFHEKPLIDHFHFWMLLEFTFALEKQVCLAHEGSYSQTIIQGFYMANKRTFEEWFKALNFKILVISHKCGFDYHAVHYGCIFIKQIVQDFVKEGSSILTELIPAPAQQTILKVRQKPQQDRSNKQLSLLRQFFKGLTYTALSLVNLDDPVGIFGLKVEILPHLEALLQPVRGIESPVFVSWMDGMKLEASENTEDAISSYNDSFQEILQTEESILSQFPVIEIKNVFQKILYLQKVFILERLAHCYTKLADWETFAEFRDLMMQEKEYKSKLRSRLRNSELEMLYDQRCFDEIENKTQNWKESIFEFRNLDDLRDSVSLMTIKKMTKEKEDSQEQDHCTTVLSNLQHLILPQETIFSSKILQLSQLLQSIENPVFHESAFEPSSRPELVLSLIFSDLSQDQIQSLKFDPHFMSCLLRLDLEELTHGVLTLLYSKFEIDHRNYDHAARLLQLISTGQDRFPDWLKLAVKSEQSRLVYLNAADDHEGSLMWSHYSQILYQDLKTLVNGPQQTLKKLLAIQCNRSVEYLESVRNSVHSNSVLADLEIPELTGDFKIKLWSQLEEAGVFESPINDHLTVLKTQVYCISSALELDPSHSQSWKKLGILLLKSKETKNPVVLKNGISALCKALETSNKTQMDYEVILEIFDLVKKTGDLILDDQRISELESVPVKTWKKLQTQLVSILGHSSQTVRQLMVTLLKRVSDLTPGEVLYPVLVEWRKNRTNHELSALIQYFENRKPGLLNNLLILFEELSNLNTLISEDWLSFLNEVHMESQIRLPVFHEELRRIKQDNRGDQERKKLSREAYNLILFPLVQSIRSKIKNRTNQSTSVFEQEYRKGLEPRIQDLLIQLESPGDLLDLPEVERKWILVKQVLKEVTEAAKKPLPVLQQLTPRLAQLQDTGIPLPGSDSITINHFEAHVKILSTKTRPKILNLRGSDHQSYSFLLKGKEDLNIDHRLLQVLEITNEFLEQDPQKKIRVYKVTPLGDRLGLIQWVDHTISFYSLFTQWQDQQKRRIRISNEAGNENRKRLSSMMDLPPKLLFKKRLSQAFSDAGLPKSVPRASWPMEVLNQVFLKLQEEAPRDLLKKQIFKQCSSACEFWKKSRKFVESTSVSSVLCFLLGLGDRHLDNLLLDLSTAEVINIDFNLCFGNGKKLRVPEIVPFRMTQIMEEALGVGKMHGPFKVVFTEVLKVLRTSKKPLLILLEAILSDPVMDWTANRVNWSFRQGLDQSLRLQVLMDRLDEKTGDFKNLQEHLDQSLELTKATQIFCSASKSVNQLTGLRNQQKLRFQGIQEELSGLLQQQESLWSQFQEQEELFEGQMKIHQEMKNTVDQIIQYNQNWCYRHGCLLQTLLNQSEELLFLPQESWNSSMSSVLRNIIIPSTTTGSSVLLTVFQNQDLESIIPLELLEECLIADQQRKMMDEITEGIFGQMLNALYHYTAILKILLSEDYICSSFHFRTLKKFKSLMTESSPTSSTAEDCYPVFEDLQKMHQSLSTAFSQIQDLIQQTKDRPASEELVPIQRSAASKIVPLQKALSSWTPRFFKTLLIELCDRQIQSIDQGIDSTTDWTQLVSGLSQIFRLFRSPRLSQALLSQFWNTDVNNADSVSTGFLWLDGVEQYMSRIAVLIQSFKNGALIDLEAFARTGLISKAQSMNRIFNQHQIQAQELCRRAWETSLQKQDQLKSNRRLVQDKNGIVRQLEEINERLKTDSNLDPVQIQTLAQDQSNLSTQLEALQNQCEENENLRLKSQQEDDENSQKLESLCESFIWDLSGTVKQFLQFENEGDRIEMQLSSQEWGDFNFPVLYSLFQIFQQLETIDGGIKDLWNEDLILQNQSELPFNCPLSFCQFESWIEGLSVTCKLTSAVQEIMENNRTVDELSCILESHFLTLLQRRAQPILLSGLQGLRTGLQRLEGNLEIEKKSENWNSGLDLILSFVQTQGQYAHCALLHQSFQSWAAGDHAEQETRLHHLAALQWCSKGLQSDSNDHQYLQDYLNQNQYPAEMGIPSRQDLILLMQGKLEALVQLEATESETEEFSHTALLHIEQYLTSSLETCTDQEQSAALINQIQNLRIEGENWKQEAKQQMSKMAHIIQTLLQFELSRDGLTWSVGEIPDQQSFLQFQDWHNRMTELKESINSAQSLMIDLDTELQSVRSRIADLKTKSESCRKEGSSVETELTQNRSIVLQSGMTVSSKMQDLMKTGPALLDYLQDSLDPWIEKFLTLTQGNKHLSELAKTGVEIHPWIECCVLNQKQIQKLMEEIWSEISSVLEEMKDEMSMQCQNQSPDFFISQSIIHKVQKLHENSTEAVESLGRLKQILDNLISSSWELIKKHDPLAKPRSTLVPSDDEIQMTSMDWISIGQFKEGTKEDRILINTEGIEMPMRTDLSTTSSQSSMKSPISKDASETPSSSSNQPTISRPLSEEQLEYTEQVLTDFGCRLSGKEWAREAEEEISVEIQTELLISEATSIENLSKMYEGWMAWI